MLNVAEHLLTFAQAARRLRVNIRTIRRWANSGINGRRLETYRTGRTVRTSLEALERFQVDASPAVDEAEDPEDRRLAAELASRHGL